MGQLIFIEIYRQRLHLEGATFTRIDHDDAMVAVVYRVTQPSGAQLILKICTRDKDYLREVYFLEHLAGRLPVPRMVQLVPPEEGVHGAILMECLPGALLKLAELTDALAYEVGSVLARLHLNRLAGYGDPARPDSLNPDPRVHFREKFEEGVAECSQNLPQALLEQCRHYYDSHLDLLLAADGPCMIHRDFRPGNLMVDGGKLQGVIDWAGGRAGFAQEDFCPLEHGEWGAGNKERFLAGYASIRPVPNYSAMMPLLRLGRAFATMGFTVKQGRWESSHARLYQLNRQFLETLLA